jgi:hypothetical protein
MAVFIAPSQRSESVARNYCRSRGVEVGVQQYGARARGLLDRANANHRSRHRRRINYSCSPNSIALMSTVQPPPRIPNLQFRVLVMGRANAGKTSILQRVCDTTESPTIYRRGIYGRKETVRGPHCVCESDLTANQFKLEPSMGVSDTRSSLRLPIDIVPARRAHHRR